jgi:hypothetical protein
MLAAVQIRPDLFRPNHPARVIRRSGKLPNITDSRFVHVVPFLGFRAHVHSLSSENAISIANAIATEQKDVGVQQF